ncbi:unnamed protein product [Calypogeia fissa]
MTKMMTEVELLTQLGSKFGTFCGGLDNFSKRQTTEAQPVPALADVTLQYDDEEFWDENPVQEEPREMPPPPLELFDAVLKEMYERISYHTTLASQALKELTAWRESLFTREAQQNVGRLEKESGTEALEPDENFDRTTIRKLGWVDRMMVSKRRRKTKGKDSDDTAAKKAIDLKAQVTGDNAPEKLEIKKKEKPLSFQGTFEKQAIEALQDMLSLVSDPTPGTESAKPMGRTAATPSQKGSKKSKDPANVSSAITKSQTKPKPNPKGRTPKPKMKTRPPQRPKTQKPRANSSVASTRVGSAEPHSILATCLDLPASTQASVITTSTTQAGSTQTYTEPASTQASVI